MFTHTAVKEIARVALSRGVGARGLRSVVEEVMEGVLDDPEAEDRAAEDILRRRLATLADQHVTNGAVVVLDAGDGAIRTMVGLSLIHI